MASRQPTQNIRRQNSVKVSNNDENDRLSDSSSGMKHNSIDITDNSVDKNNNKRVFESEYIKTEKTERINKRWDITNTITIVEWINCCNLYVLTMDTYLTNLRSVLRVNTLWSLLISSITSTVSITQFTITDTDYPLLSMIVKGAIFLTSIITSLITGYIKVEKIQEKIEQVDKTRYKWLQFLFLLTSELQVGAKLRNNAEELICNKRNEFNKLSSKRLEVPKSVERAVSLFLTKRSRLVRTQMDLNRRHMYQCCCKSLFDKMRYGIKYDNNLNVEFAQQSLSIYKMNLDLVKNELFLLAKIYSDIISEIQFDHFSDILRYDIITNDVNLNLNNDPNKNGMTSYSPISSDDDIESINHNYPSYKNRINRNRKLRTNLFNKSASKLKNRRINIIEEKGDVVINIDNDLSLNTPVVNIIQSKEVEEIETDEEHKSSGVSFNIVENHILKHDVDSMSDVTNTSSDGFSQLDISNNTAQ